MEECRIVIHEHPNPFAILLNDLSANSECEVSHYEVFLNFIACLLLAFIAFSISTVHK